MSINETNLLIVIFLARYYDNSRITFLYCTKWLCNSESGNKLVDSLLVSDISVAIDFTNKTI